MTGLPKCFRLCEEKAVAVGDSLSLAGPASLSSCPPAGTAALGSGQYLLQTEEKERSRLEESLKYTREGGTHLNIRTSAFGVFSGFHGPQTFRKQTHATKHHAELLERKVQLCANPCQSSWFNNELAAGEEKIPWGLLSVHSTPTKFWFTFSFQNLHNLWHIFISCVLLVSCRWAWAQSWL